MTKRQKEQMLQQIDDMRKVIATTVADEEVSEDRLLVTVADVHVWLWKWKGYIDDDIISRMASRLCDIPRAVVKANARLEVGE